MSELAYKRTNVYEKADAETMQAIFEYAEGYRKFIDGGKTERERFRGESGEETGI